MAEWIKVTDEASFDESIGVECKGHQVALFRLEDGIHALDDICSHEYSRLSEGEIWDDEVYCPKHGSRFHIRTGSVKGLPAVKPVRSYPVRVEKGAVYLEWEGEESDE
ncbi:MAG TPA: non-heme iron oxygenase ferredoxin subunit [Spirochaetia bacterium]|nr:non-heme iron oxygenase ferredoxin subunit [Spirochaetia bacterium]